LIPLLITLVFALPSFYSLYFGGDVHFDLGELEGTPHLAEKTPLSMPALDSVEERGNDVSGYKWFFTTLEEYLYCFGLPIIASSGAIEFGLTTTGGWLLDTLTSNFCLRGFDLSRVMGAFTGGPTTVTKPVFSAPTQTLVDTLEVVTEIPTQTLAEAVITRVPDYPIERVTRVSKQIIVDLASEQEAEDIMGGVMRAVTGYAVCDVVIEALCDVIIEQCNGGDVTGIFNSIMKKGGYKVVAYIDKCGKK